MQKLEEIAVFNAGPDAGIRREPDTHAHCPDPIRVRFDDGAPGIHAQTPEPPMPPDAPPPPPPGPIEPPDPVNPPMEPPMPDMPPIGDPPMQPGSVPQARAQLTKLFATQARW